MPDVFVTGTTQLKRNIRSLKAEMQQKTLRTATRAAAKVIEAEAEQLAPVDEGGLKAGIVTVKERDFRKWHVAYLVKVVKAYYWWFVENGTEKMPAQPFLKPAFELKAEEAAAKAISILNRTIDKWNSKSLKR